MTKLRFAQKEFDLSNYGVFFENGSEWNHQKRVFFEIKRNQKKIGKSRIFQVHIKNITIKPVSVYSVVVADFVVPEKFAPIEVLENGWGNSSFSGYKNVSNRSLENKIFLKRDTNPYSFKKEYGYIKDSVVSEWFTGVRFEKKSIVIGALTTAKQFSQIYLKKLDSGINVRITCQFDGIKIKPGETVSSENIFLNAGSNEKRQLSHYASLIAKYMNLTKQFKSIRGTCSYYWKSIGNYVDQAIMEREVEKLKKSDEKLKIDYIQIDAGYSEHWGDWLNYTKRFPDMLGLVRAIKKLGYKPGIWLAPFVANPNSELFRSHPDWFLKNHRGCYFEGRNTSPFDNLILFFRFRVLDLTNKNVIKYITHVITHFKKMGFELIKLDFLYPICFTENNKNLTRAELLRFGLDVIRKASGEKIHLLSGIVPLSSVVGIADSARVGIDTINPYVSNVPILNYLVNNKMLRDNLMNSNSRQFLNGKVWNNDPDCVIMRKGTGLKKELIKKHIDFVRENNTSWWVGDSLNDLTSDQRATLFKLLESNNIP